MQKIVTSSVRCLNSAKGTCLEIWLAPNIPMTIFTTFSANSDHFLGKCAISYCFKKVTLFYILTVVAGCLMRV
jgi:hypothetical protein